LLRPRDGRVIARWDEPAVAIARRHEGAISATAATYSPADAVATKLVACVVERPEERSSVALTSSDADVRRDAGIAEESNGSSWLHARALRPPVPTLSPSEVLLTYPGWSGPSRRMNALESGRRSSPTALP
jgi:hypothetical protein